MNSFKRIGFLLLVCFLETKAIGAAACSGQQKAGKELLRIGVVEQIENFSPITQKIGENQYIRNFVTPPVVAIDETWRWKCVVCTEIPTIDNGKLQIIEKSGKFKLLQSDWEIRKDFFWEDGTPVTGWDIKFTLKEFKKGIPLEVERAYFPVKEVRVDSKNPRKYTIIFNRNSADYFQYLAVSLLFSKKNISSSPKDSKEVADVKSPVTSYGSYKVENIGKDKVYLKQNPYYLGKRNSFPNIVVRKFKTKKQMIESYFGGYIDLVKESEFSIGEVSKIKNRFERSGEGSKHKLVFEVSNTLEQIVLNLRNPLFTDPVIRRSLLLAINRDKIVSEVFSGYGKKAMHLIHEKEGIGSLKGEKYQYDMEKANFLLDNAGFHMGKDGIRRKNKSKLEITWVSVDSPERRAIFNIVKKNWNAIGVKVRLKTYPRGEFFRTIVPRSQFHDLANYAWVKPPSDFFLTVFHGEEIPSSRNNYEGKNISGWFRKEVNLLLKKLAQEYSKDKRQPIVRDIMNYYLADLPTLPILYRPVFALHSNKISGFIISGHTYESSLYSDHWGCM